MTDTQQAAALHPDWCFPSSCEVELLDGGVYRGDHFQPARRVTTEYGATFGIALTCEVADENNPYLALRISTPASSEEGADFAWQAETYRLEPEEMLLLARKMTEAANAWYGVRRDHRTTQHPAHLKAS